MSIGKALVAIGESKVDPSQSLQTQGKAIAQTMANIGQLQAQVIGNASKQFTDLTNNMIKSREAQYKAVAESYNLAKENLQKAGATGYKNAYLKEFATSKQQEINQLMLEIQNTSAYKKQDIRNMKTQVDALINQVDRVSNDVAENYKGYLDLQADIDKGDVYEYEALEAFEKLSNPNTPPLSQYKLREVMNPYLRRTDEMNEYFNDEIFKKMDDDAFTVDANGNKIRNSEIFDKLYSMYNDTPDGIRAIDFYQRGIITGQQKTYTGVNDLNTLLSSIDDEVMADMSTPENQNILNQMKVLKANISNKLQGQITDEQLQQIMQNPSLLNVANESLKGFISEDLSKYNDLRSKLNLNFVDVGQIYDLYSPDIEGEADQDAMLMLGLVYNEQFDKSPNNQNNIPQFVEFLRNNKAKFGETKVQNTINLLNRKLEETLPEAIKEYSYSRFSNKSFKSSQKLREDRIYKQRMLSKKSGSDDVFEVNLNPQAIQMGDGVVYNFDGVFTQSTNAKVAPPLVKLLGTDGQELSVDNRDDYIFFDGGDVIGSVDSNGYMVTSSDELLVDPDGTPYRKGLNKMYRAIEKDAIINMLQQQDNISVEQATANVESGNISSDILSMLQDKSQYFFVNQDDYRNFNVSSTRKKEINAKIEKANSLSANIYSSDVEAAINSFANANNITREEAIKLLKENNKL